MPSVRQVKISKKYSTRALKAIRLGFAYHAKIDAKLAQSKAEPDSKKAGAMAYGAWMMTRHAPETGPFTWLMVRHVHQMVSIRGGFVTCSCALRVPWDRGKSRSQNLSTFVNLPGHLEHPSAAEAKFFIAQCPDKGHGREYRYFCVRCGLLDLVKKDERYGEGFRQGDYDEREFNLLRKQHRHEA